MMTSGEYNECDYGMVIDVYQLLPSDYIQNIDQTICDIFYFIVSNVTGEERFQILKYTIPPTIIPIIIPTHKIVKTVSILWK